MVSCKMGIEIQPQSRRRFLRSGLQLPYPVGSYSYLLVPSGGTGSSGASGRTACGCELSLTGTILLRFRFFTRKWDFRFKWPKKPEKWAKKEGSYVLKDIRALINQGFIPEVRLPNYFSGAVILFPFLGSCCGIPASCSFSFHMKMFSMWWCSIRYR